MRTKRGTFTCNKPTFLAFKCTVRSGIEVFDLGNLFLFLLEQLSDFPNPGAGGDVRDVPIPGLRTSKFEFAFAAARKEVAPGCKLHHADATL